ncbi:hypothetical protein [Streptomyces sp. NPDC058964]|uniref:hypothetical protein n=1 Tax=Streptomyces sp. NPDC058964 TaxID=3346681 RepID=UPI0036A190BE
MGSVLNPVDSSVIAVTLVPIGVAFGAPARRSGWSRRSIRLAARELRVPDPFVDLRLPGGNVPLPATHLRRLLGCTTAFMYGYRQWLEQVRGLSASTAGLTLLPPPDCRAP